MEIEAHYPPSVSHSTMWVSILPDPIVTALQVGTRIEVELSANITVASSKPYHWLVMRIFHGILSYGKRS